MRIPSHITSREAAAELRFLSHRVGTLRDTLKIFADLQAEGLAIEPQAIDTVNRALQIIDQRAQRYADRATEGVL
jgi:hypothetical protein